MKSKEGTFIHEDMYEAIDQAMKSTVPESRRVLVWLTDGAANFENSLTQKTIGKQAPARLHTKEETTTKASYLTIRLGYRCGNRFGMDIHAQKS
jgi:glycerate kinase